MTSSRKRPSFGIRPGTVLRRKDLTATAKLVYGLLSWHQGANETAWPSLKLLAEEAGVAVSSVERAIGQLEGAGLLRRGKRASSNGRYAGNKYTVFAEPHHYRKSVAAPTDFEQRPLPKIGNEVRQGKETKRRASAKSPSSEVSNTTKPKALEALDNPFQYLRGGFTVPNGAVVDIDSISEWRDRGEDALREGDEQAAARWNEKIRRAVENNRSGNDARPLGDILRERILEQNPHLKMESFDELKTPKLAAV